MVLRSIDKRVWHLLTFSFFLTATFIAKSSAMSSGLNTLNYNKADLLAQNDLIDSRFHAKEALFNPHEISSKGKHHLEESLFGAGLHGHLKDYSETDETDNDSRSYESGITKRGNHYAIRLSHKHPRRYKHGKKEDRMYAFGLGKRDEYVYGVRKLIRYFNGLGKKRDPYAFGLGK